MIVQSIGTNVIPASSGIGKTSVKPQSAIKFAGNQTPHATLMSGFRGKIGAGLMTLGLFAGCDGTEPLPSDVETSTYIDTTPQPDGGTKPAKLPPRYLPQPGTTDEKEITPHYGIKPRPTDEHVIKAPILDEAGNAVKMLDKNGNTVSLKILGKGKKAVAQFIKLA